MFPCSYLRNLLWFYLQALNIFSNFHQSSCTQKTEALLKSTLYSAKCKLFFCLSFKNTLGFNLDYVFVGSLSRGLKVQKMTCDTESQRRYMWLEKFFSMLDFSYNINILNLFSYVRQGGMRYYKLAWSEGSKLCMSVAWHLSKMYAPYCLIELMLFSWLIIFHVIC